jgi:FkbM family methyltransferase
MKRSEVAFRLAHHFPACFRTLLTLSLEGYLPLGIYNNWVSEAIEKTLWEGGYACPACPWIGRTVRLRNGMRIEVDPRDYIGRKIIAEGCFEPETFEFIQSYIQPGMIFLDIGANVGQYTLLGSQLVGPGGKVYAFEPHPILSSVLSRNVGLNECSNVLCEKLAVAEREGVQTLFHSPPNRFGETALVPYAEQTESTPVRTVSVDAYVRSNMIEQVDLIKIDVEGAELHVLEGATDLLTGSAGLTLILEFNDGAARRFGHWLADLASFLRARGFALYRLGADGLRPYIPLEREPVFFNIVASRDAELCS